MDRKQQHCFCYISISNEQGTILRNTSLFRVSLNSSFMAHNSVMGLVKITRPIQNYSTSDPYGHMEWPHYLERPNFISGVAIWI